MFWYSQATELKTLIQEYLKHCYLTVFNPGVVTLNIRQEARHELLKDEP